MDRPYQLVSSDSHLEVLPERWSHRVPSHLREGAPRSIRTAEGGDALVIGDQLVQPANPTDLYAGRDHAVSDPFDVKYEDAAGTGPPEQRLKEQDADGVDAEVLFPGQVGGPAFWRNVTDDTVYKAVVRAYNDWLAEECCAVAPDRLIGLGVMPWTNAEDMVTEMEHCAKLGLKGVVLGVLPSAQGYPTPEDDRFWVAAVDMKMPVTVHVRFYRTGH